MDNERTNKKIFHDSQEADRRIRLCALYLLSHGFTITRVPPSQVMRLFSELKNRLRLGCWENISHLQASVVLMYGVPIERQG